MKIITAVLVTFLSIPSFAVDKSVPAPAADSDSAVKPNAALVKLLSKNGYKIAKSDGSIIKASPVVTISREMLKSGGLDYTDDGKLSFRENMDIPPTDAQILDILAGLCQFAAVRDLDAGKVGKTLQAWGIPPAYDGVHLYNPDGTATYYGLMLYKGIYDKPDAIKMMSGERLSASIKLFGDAYSQAFHQAAADAGLAKLNDAWGLLQDGPIGGEKRLDLRPSTDIGDSLKEYKARLAAEKGSKQAAASLAALNALEKYRYHQDLDIPGKVPAPKEESDDKEKNTPPLHATMPLLLSTLDKINGKPLTAQQEEWLIKSFPMGEVVWRAGAQKIWKQGATGKGVKVAVIDDGAGFNADLDGSVVSRETFTHQRGKGTIGAHGTHVAGTVHALAPDAEIRSYQALEDAATGNPALAQRGSDQTDGAIMRAIDKAVKDGNQIINMSLGGAGSPSGPMALKIEEYAKKGVLFVIAAGNDAAKNDVESPSSAPSAITVGALDVNDRMTSFSSYGSTFDPRRMKEVVKTIFMAPGDNIVSTLPGDEPHGPMSGTSMATPDMSGTIALLVQGYRDFNLSTDPVTMSERIKEALAGTAKAIPRNELPSGVPPKQQFLIVDPNAAYSALRPKS